MAVTPLDLHNASKSGGKTLRDKWCEHIEGKTKTQIDSGVKKDVKGNDAGSQHEYDDGTYIYENIDVFAKRTIVWANSKLTNKEVDDIIAKRKADEVTSREEVAYVEAGKNKSEKLERIIEKWGMEHGFYEAIHTLPDGSVYMRLKAEYR